MAKRTYRIVGRVINRRTREGVPNVRVEVWDKDTKYHDLIGERVTDSGGNFQKTYDETYFGDYAPDRMPDLFFKVFQDENLLLSTEKNVMWNVREGDTRVTLEIDVPVEVEASPDRVSGEQVMNGVEFIRQSDFKGALRDVGKKTNLFGGLVANMVKATVSKMDFAPIKPPSHNTDDVINQHSTVAEENLRREHVVVNEVKPYDPGLNATSFGMLAGLPVNLKAGDKVDLYKDDNGIVRYYSVVKEKQPVDINAADVVRLNNEVTTLRSNVRELS